MGTPWGNVCATGVGALPMAYPTREVAWISALLSVSGSPLHGAMGAQRRAKEAS